MIRVLHISQASGGVKTYLSLIINNSSQGFVHYIITPDKKFGKEIESAAKVSIVKIKRSPSLMDLIAILKILIIASKIKPTLIHCHSAKGGVIGRIVGRILNIKVIFTPNGFSYLPFEGLKRLFFQRIERLLRPSTDLLLGVSESEAKRAINDIGYDKKAVTFVSNAININKKSKQIYTYQGKIGMIGRLTYQKNPLQYLKLAERLRSIKFLLLGAGFHDDLKRKMVKEIGISRIENFEIIPWGSFSNIYEFYDSIDVFVLTSKFEGLPFSLLEAMEYGIPAVVSNVDGNRDAIDHGVNGFIYNTFDELFEYISMLMADENLRARVGSEARRKVERCFNIKKNIVEIEEKYTSIQGFING